MNGREETFSKIMEQTLPAAHHDRAATAGARNAHALLCMSVDHFGGIAAAAGHDQHDELLREVGARLTRALRTSDAVVHWGADEFVVLLRNAGDRRSVARVTRKLISACNGPYVLGEVTRYVTLRIGYSLFPSDARDMVSLLRRARQANKVLKSFRKNRPAPTGDAAIKSSPEAEGQWPEPAAARIKGNPVGISPPRGDALHR